VTYAGEAPGVKSRALICYASNIGTYFYGGLDMGDTMSDNQSKGGPDPTAPPDADELGPEEKMQAERYMKHYQQNDPVMRYCATQYATMQQAAQAPVQGAEPVKPGTPDSKVDPKADAGKTEPVKPDAKPPEKEPKNDYQADAASIHYAQLQQQVGTLIANQKEFASKLEALQTTNTAITEKYAMEQSKRILTELVSEGYVINDVPKKLAKMTKMDDAGRTELATEIRENYAKEDVAPTGPMIGIFDELATLPNAKGGEATSEEIDLAVAYAEEHKMNPEKDWDKILVEVRKAM